MLLIASRNPRVLLIETHILYVAYQETLFGMIQCICHDRQAYTRICMYMYTQIASDSVEKEGARSRNVVATERKERGRRNDMHRKSDLSKRKHCMCECVCVFKR